MASENQAVSYCIQHCLHQSRAEKVRCIKRPGVNLQQHRLAAHTPSRSQSRAFHLRVKGQIRVNKYGSQPADQGDDDKRQLSYNVHGRYYPYRLFSL